MTVRPLSDADVDGAVAVQIAAFDDHDRRGGRPVPEVTPERIDSHCRRVRHLLTHDPAGSWVAESGGRVVGVGLALRRGRLWGLSLLAVDPAAQSRGVGGALLAATLTYADEDAPAVILSSSDPRAIHRYAAAGFALHPQMRATGTVTPSRLQEPEPKIREGTPDDYAFADEVDLAVRGAPRGPDHQLLAAQGVMYVAEDGARRGYAHVHGGRVRAIAATDEQTARALLWRSLAHAYDLGVDATVEHIAGNQQWAVRVAVDAGLSLAPSGPVFWRQGAPPPAYLPCGPYL